MDFNKNPIFEIFAQEDIKNSNFYHNITNGSNHKERAIDRKKYIRFNGLSFRWLWHIIYCNFFGRWKGIKSKYLIMIPQKITILILINILTVFKVNKKHEHQFENIDEIKYNSIVLKI